MCSLEAQALMEANANYVCDKGCIEVSVKVSISGELWSNDTKNADLESMSGSCELRSWADPAS